ncbi:hypothetical protein SAMN04487910_3607 [Aquimarina amphilecti]|uniref:Uncharacterized protein n=1 Tax=Aquimarina amphilecti TaxID=1038014 RepID=A0A1H7U677_AQUAM|nr:hypothetical protein [Aquimarina amphilecti]SEL92582.1 hypothetical protein SAMN04487910_3607 [Aquimarina amphilecti]
MKYYYQLQCKRLYRSFKDFGTEPIIGFPIIIGLFYWLSLSFFNQVPYASYVYVLLSTVFIYAFNTSGHNEFIKQHFSTSNFRKIKLLNSLIGVMPFVVFSLYKACYIEVFLIFVLALLTSWGRKRNKVSLIIPTPFNKQPWEFIIGFRKTFWLFFLIYALVIVAIVKGNFNLGLFSIVAIFFICSTYYLKKDPEFYIWIYAMNSKEFLKYKVVTALWYSFILTIPICISLSLFYADQIHVILLFLILGWVYLIMYVFMKYAFQSQGLEIMQGVIGVLCILFPPLMVITLPYFYNKALNNLDLLLK